MLKSLRARVLIVLGMKWDADLNRSVSAFIGREHHANKALHVIDQCDCFERKRKSRNSCRKKAKAAILYLHQAQGSIVIELNILIRVLTVKPEKGMVLHPSAADSRRPLLFPKFFDVVRQ